MLEVVVFFIGFRIFGLELFLGVGLNVDFWVFFWVYENRIFDGWIRVYVCL